MGARICLLPPPEFLPAIRNFTRQIVPPVVATLLAAVLIAGYNRAFTGHLVQPRMGMMHGDVIGTDEARASGRRRDGEAARSDRRDHRRGAGQRAEPGVLEGQRSRGREG